MLPFPAWDKDALLWINSHHNLVLDAIFFPVSLVGERAAIWITVALALLIVGRPGWRWTGLLLLASMFLTDQFVAQPISHHIQRIRPYLALNDVRQLGYPWHNFSFPSGHAHVSWLAAVILGVRFPKLILPLVAFAALTCYSRPYLGLHYPIDVMAGALLGIISGFAVLRFEKLGQRLRTEKEPCE